MSRKLHLKYLPLPGSDSVTRIYYGERLVGRCYFLSTPLTASNNCTYSYYIEFYPTREEFFANEFWQIEDLVENAWQFYKAHSQNL